MESEPGRGPGITVDKVKVLSGAPYDPARPGEAMIDPGLAAWSTCAPGDTLRLTRISTRTDGMTPIRQGGPLTFTVTAIGVFDDQVVPPPGQQRATDLLSPRPDRRPPACRQGSIDYLAQADVRLRPGADPAAFITAAQALASRYPGVRGRRPRLHRQLRPGDRHRTGNQAARGRARVFAALAGLIALAVIGQLLARQMTLDAAGYGVLSALGMTRGGLFALAAARLALVTVAGGVIAVGIAIAASPLMPIGAARLAEPQPGVDLDPLVLGVGFAAVVLLPLMVLAAPAIRAVRQARGGAGAAGPVAVRPTARPSWLAGTLTRAGTVTGGIGTRMAFEPGHGRTAVPVRSALAGTAIAVAAVVAAAVFGTSLVGLVSSPQQYGQNWDQQLNLGFESVPSSYAAQFAAATPDVTGYALGDYRPAQHRRDAGSRRRRRPCPRRRLPDDAGRAAAGERLRDRARRAEHARSRRADRADRAGTGRLGDGRARACHAVRAARDWHGRAARLRPGRAEQRH